MSGQEKASTGEKKKVKVLMLGDWKGKEMGTRKEKNKSRMKDIVPTLLKFLEIMKEHFVSNREDGKGPYQAVENPQLIGTIIIPKILEIIIHGFSKPQKLFLKKVLTFSL